MGAAIKFRELYAEMLIINDGKDIFKTSKILRLCICS